MPIMIVVCYDVSTETAEGRKRLRHVAKVCEGVGQRVQKSVFECRLDLMQYEALERRLLGEIDPTEDNLRIYRLTEPSTSHVKEFGKFRSTDFEGPLVI
jgi:CRISPR-associated protein Cas2